MVPGHFHLTASSLQWVDDIGGVKNLGNKLLKRRKDEELPVFTPPEVNCSPCYLEIHLVIEKIKMDVNFFHLI